MKEQFTDWLAACASACESRRVTLTGEDRTDEARFERIRCNVYDLFRTTVDAMHRAENDEEAAWQRFEEKLRDIPSAWRRSHEQAQCHGDAEKAHIERLKLDAAEEIERHYRELRGVRA